MLLDGWNVVELESHLQMRMEMGREEERVNTPLNPRMVLKFVMVL